MVVSGFQITDNIDRSSVYFPIEFFLPVTIVIIPDVLVTNRITKLYQSCLVVMASQTMLARMKFSITGTPNSHVRFFFITVICARESYPSQ